MPPDAPTEPAVTRATKRKPLRRMLNRAVVEPWRVMAFVWQAINAALLPISLRDVPAALGRFLEHLQRSREVCRERRAAVFFRHLQGMLA